MPINNQKQHGVILPLVAIVTICLSILIYAQFARIATLRQSQSMQIYGIRRYLEKVTTTLLSFSKSAAPRILRCSNAELELCGFLPATSHNSRLSDLSLFLKEAFIYKCTAETSRVLEKSDRNHHQSCFELPALQAQQRLGILGNLSVSGAALDSQHLVVFGFVEIKDQLQLSGSSDLQSLASVEIQQLVCPELQICKINIWSATGSIQINQAQGKILISAQAPGLILLPINSLRLPYTSPEPEMSEEFLSISAILD